MTCKQSVALQEEKGVEFSSVSPSISALKNWMRDCVKDWIHLSMMLPLCLAVFSLYRN